MVDGVTLPLVAVDEEELLPVPEDEPLLFEPVDELLPFEPVLDEPVEEPLALLDEPLFPEELMLHTPQDASQLPANHSCPQNPQETASLHDSEGRGVSVQTVLFVAVEPLVPPPRELVELPFVLPMPPAVELEEFVEFVALEAVEPLVLEFALALFVDVAPLVLPELVPSLQLQSHSQLHAPPVPFAVPFEPGPTASSPRLSQPAS